MSLLSRSANPAAQKKLEDYHGNAEKRERIKEINRKSARNYYQLTPTQLYERLGNDLSLLPTYGNLRSILKFGESLPVHEICFTNVEMATALGRTWKTFSRWQSLKMFPKPVCITYIKWNALHYAIYPLEQASYLCKVMAEHTSKKAYLSVDDRETIDALWNFKYYA